MSKRNREKRTAKQKSRRRAATERDRLRFAPGPDRVHLLECLVMELSEAATWPDTEASRHANVLLEKYRAWVREIDVAADIAVNEAIRAAWEHGWSPSDLHEIACRRIKSTAVQYLDEAILLESRRYAVSTLHPRWRADLACISAAVGPITSAPQLWRWAANNGIDRREALAVVIKVLNLLGRIPAIGMLLPLPGEHRHIPTVQSDAVEKALSKVRALLAKAEATEFSDEAEALSAKAQELMSRYSLRETVVCHDRGQRPVAAVRRIWIDNPYAAAKSLLAQAVGTANRCRVVWAENMGFVTVIGSETDLDLVELLTTSLLVQASRAMLSAGRQAGSQTRTKAFRQSFLVAYATRIGERLEGVRSSVTDAINQDGRLLPALTAASRATDELTERLFPAMVHRPVSVASGAGWGAGRAAADMAALDVRESIAG